MHGDTEISNTEDMIDSRDIAARIAYLERDKEIAEDPEDPAPDYFTEDDAAELTKLRALAEKGRDNAEDWDHGATLIRESYFVEYAEQFADDIGAISSDVSWPLTHIDWDAAADDLKSDYSEIDFDGETYLVR